MKNVAQERFHGVGLLLLGVAQQVDGPTCQLIDQIRGPRVLEQEQGQSRNRRDGPRDERRVSHARQIVDQVFERDEQIGRDGPVELGHRQEIAKLR
ncbi:MAG TPA: hypothetical protein VML75_23540, partial [Kofleriaceae bacterium]|nr:hypothetical protein [Kofleriaceae bacterium]